MHVAWDISSIPFGTGVSSYFNNLVRACYAQYPQDSYTLFGSSFRQYRQLHNFIQNFPQTNDKIYPFSPSLNSLLFNTLHFPIEPLVGSVDIFHSWDWYTPKTRTASLVTTIYDLTALKFPAETHPSIVQHHRQALKWIKKEARAIIAISNSTKNDIIELLDIEPERVHVVYLALPKQQVKKPVKKSVKEVVKKYSINKPFIISVGSKEPRKNLPRVIQAWKKLKNEYNLVLVGKSGYQAVSAVSGVIQTGYLPNQELAALYSQAACMVYPSLYEGFGLPILEAFYHKTPVVTSNVSSMPEVAGEAAVLVDPESVESITNGITEAITNRRTLIALGSQQLNNFSWEKTAKQTMAIYGSVYEQNR